MDGPMFQPLIDEHAGPFRVARALMEAETPEQRRAALASFVTLWNERISGHFELEERHLLPAIGDCDARRRLLSQHEDLRRMAAAAMLVGPEPDADWVRRLGQSLHDHLRWEETELFPKAEAQLGPEERERLAAALRPGDPRRQGGL